MQVQIYSPETDKVLEFTVSAPEVGDLLAFGRKHRWLFQSLSYKGEIEAPVVRDGWVYEQVTDPARLPSFALKRLQVVQDAGFPIHQVIIGREIKDIPKTEPEKESKPPQYSRQQKETAKTLPDGFTEDALKAIAITFVGAAVILGSALVMALSAVDPRLIVSLKTSEGEFPWVLLVSWEE